MKKLLLILLCLPMIGSGQPQYQLDSLTSSPSVGITKFTYDSQGRCIKEMGWNSEIIYNYNLNNNLIQAQMTFFATPFYKFIYSYDSNNNLIEIENYVWDTTQYILETITTVNYNGNQINYAESHDVNNTLTNRVEYTWQAGNLDYKITYRHLPASDTTKEEYIYSNGNIEQINDYHYQNNSFLLTNSTTFSYNSIPLAITAHGVMLYPAGMNSISSNMFTNQITEYGDSSSTAYCHYSSWSGGTSSIQEYNINKEFLKVIDLLGRETIGKKNEPLFYIYDDGTVEKRIVIE